jgi:hypothetical protein
LSTLGYYKTEISGIFTVSVGECMQREGITLLSYGDCIKPGYYRIHSSFENAINFTEGKRLVSLVNMQAGNGPFHIVLSQLDRFRIDSIRLTERYLEAEGVRFEFEGSKKFISVPSPSFINSASALRLLLRFQDILIQSSPALSLVFLIDGRRKRNLVSAFEKALAERAVSGWTYFMEGKVEEGARIMRGVGYGFTPGGDDFIAGIATGLYMLQRFFGGDVSEELEVILRNSVSGNVVADSFIALAAKGHFMEGIKNFIEAIVEGNEKKFVFRAPELIEMGETSGADFSTGILCAFKMHGMFD